MIPTDLYNEQEKVDALTSLVEAERSFARTSVEKGVRDSFLEFFADDGINFQPGPTNTKEFFRSRPAPTGKPVVVLDWRPVYADIAEAGDLGYTTGPYILTDNGPDKRPPQYGYFFSIWQRQADGNWKVALDAGIRVPETHSLEKVDFQPAPQIKRDKPLTGDAEGEGKRLIELDQEFSRESSTKGAAGTALKYYSDDARLHRDGVAPAIGTEPILELLGEIKGGIALQPQKALVSRSLDFGYTYGSYEVKEGGEKGYYVRVWRKDIEGQWEIAFETQLPLPKSGK